MSDRHDAVANHVVHQRLAATEKRVRALDLKDIPAAEDHAQRIREVLRHAGAKTTDADLDLISPGMLDRVAAQLDPLDAQLGQFEAECNVAYLEQAAGSCDALLDAVAPIPAPAPDKELKATRKAAAELRSHFAEILGELRAGQATVADELASVGEQIAAAKTASGTDVAAVKAELDAARVTVGEQTTRADAALAAFEADSASQVAVARAAFETSSADLFAEAKSNAATALSMFEDTTGTATKEFTERAEASVAKLEELRDEAANLVGVVAGTATAGGFKKVADEEHKTADYWRKVTVVSVVAVVGIGIWILVAAAGKAEFGWDRLTAKFLVSVPLGVLAGYAGRQSAGHRDTERRARHVQLQLAALEPYVESLPDAEASKIRGELANHVFGPPPDAMGAGDAEMITGSALVGLLEKALSGIAKR